MQDLHIRFLNDKRYLVLQYLIILIISFFISILFEEMVWVRSVESAHTFLELVCIFIALSTFFIIWFTYKHNSISNKFIGLGFLAIAIFDIFHTNYWAGLKLFPSGYYGLSAWHWMMGRFTEAIVILLITSRKTKLYNYNNKWIGLLFSFTFSVGVSFMFLKYPSLFPLLMTENGVTPLKILLEILVNILFTMSVFNIVKEVSKKDFLENKYILLSLLIAIPAELCFTMFTTITSFYNTLGHVLKVTYYFYIFRGIFVSAVLYPYNKLNDSKIELEEMYKKLEDTNKHYYDLLNKLPLALINYKSDYKLKFANSSALNLLDCQFTDVEGLTVKEMISAFYSPREQIKRPYEKRKINSFYTIKNVIRTINNKSGKVINLSLDVHKLNDNDFIVLLNEAKREQELENLQLQTQTILNSINNTVSVMDRHNKIIMCNNAFESVFEVKAKDVLGMDKTDFNKLMSFSNNDITYNYKIDDGKVYEVSIMTPNLNKKDILIMPAPVFNIEKEKIGYIIIGTDITELKIEQQKIQQQEKLAIIGQMGAGIVHETKNHLASISGYCQLISLKSMEEDIKKYAEKIHNISNNVNKVIINFLELAKPGESTKDVISINEIIESTKYMLESPSFMKGVLININLGDFDKDLLADEAQIKQVLLNITKNAIEAMTEVENPKLYISTELSESQREVLLIITENGKGIENCNLANIGKPFYTTKENGTGLGLSVSYKIIHEHSGNISVRSQVGVGTTFIISLPCIDD